MSEFSPYIISHVQLTEISALELPGGNHYVVFWCNTIPLGHIWFETRDQEIIQQDFYDKINKALESSVSYYSEQFNGCTNLLNLLHKGDYKNLASELTALTTKLFQQTTTAENKPISVVICTRNRPLSLANCLKTLMACDDKNFEIIVVDNAPSDNQSKELVAGFENVQYVLERRKGLDIARNTGARHATHDIVAYTDDDVKVPPNWISVIKTSFDNPLTMAVTGLAIPTDLETITQVIFERDWGFNKGYRPQVFDRKYFLERVDTGVPAWDVGAGANMAFRKEAFLLAGWFDERLDLGASGCSGDSEMWYRIMAEGWTCIYYPHLFVYHQHRRSPKELKAQLYHYMRGHVSALLVQYEKYHHVGNLKRIYKGFPKYFYYKAKSYLLNADKRKHNSFLTELRGCVSGWGYYYLNKHKKGNDVTLFPDTLAKDVIINNDSLVSIIIPCHNNGDNLPNAINSVFQQTHLHTEIIVVDDGSDVNIAALCSNYGDKIRYVRVEPMGQSAARNAGVQFSKGSFIVFLDADDFLYPNALENNLTGFNNYKKAAFVSGAHTMVNEQGEPLPTQNNGLRWGDNYLALLQGNYIVTQSSVMYRRDLFFSFHFDSQLQTCEDYDLNLTIARYFPVLSHEKMVAAYRQQSPNNSVNLNLLKETVFKVLRKQKPLLKTNEERTAYESGLKNWKLYYNQKATVPL